MNENNHFVEYININNFKCFKDFRASGFSRVNLIGGKNNVGKTAFMEAIFINVNSQELSNFCFALTAIKWTRENLNILQDFLDGKIQNINNKIMQSYLEKSNGVDIQSNQSNISFNIEEKEGVKKYHFKYKNQETNVNINEFSFSYSLDESIDFIDNFGLSNKTIIEYYSFIQKKDNEDYLNNLLKEFDSQIESFKIIDDKPQCKANGEYREITEFGDGLRHLISIVVSLFKTENGYLFIDEIDNGIHYTQMDTLWEVIMKMTYDLNVQLFATTHSKECIESYARVNQSIFKTDSTFTVLSRLKDNSIKAIVRDYDAFTSSLEEERELR